MEDIKIKFTELEQIRDNLHDIYITLNNLKWMIEEVIALQLRVQPDIVGKTELVRCAITKIYSLLVEQEREIDKALIVDIGVR
jgi:hypothetical protein